MHAVASRRTGPLALAFALSLAAGCQRGPKGPAPRHPAQVVVEAAAVRSVPLELAAVGTAVPVATIAVRASVSGTLEKVGFREGEEVRVGQVLFQLDARPFQAALSQARAALARDEAQLANAEVEAQRYAKLLPDGVVSQSDSEGRTAQARALRATVEADRAALETARVNLDDTVIRSPVTGLAGNLLVDAGNLVKANDTTPLVVVRQMRPMDISFTVPAQDLPAVREAQARGPVPVSAVPRGATSPALGQLSFIDNTVDAASGNVLMKARYPNAGTALWPGQFADVKLTVGRLEQAVVVPARAVLAGQGGDRVFVVTKGDTAESRLVKAGPRDGDAVVVLEGVAAGERVVVDGLLGLAPGAKVEVREPAAPARAAAPRGEAGATAGKLAERP